MFHSTSWQPVYCPPHVLNTVRQTLYRILCWQYSAVVNYRHNIEPAVTIEIGLGPIHFPNLIGLRWAYIFKITTMQLLILVIRICSLVIDHLPPGKHFAHPSINCSLFSKSNSAINLETGRTRLSKGYLSLTTPSMKFWYAFTTFSI